MGELITATFGLAGTAGALRAARSDPRLLKVVIHSGK
jgi:hypothetical protein